MALIPETKLQIIRQLNEEPMHGYALAKRLRISHGYIYTLPELQEEGMIKEGMIEGDENALPINGERRAVGEAP